jgi:hypothetical protein
VAKLKLGRYRRFFEGFAVSVAYHESYIVDTFLIHMIDGIATATAYTDDLDDARRRGCRNIEWHH